MTTPHPPSYALPGLPWRCTRADALASLRSQPGVRVLEATDDAIAFASEDHGYAVAGLVSLHFGRLSALEFRMHQASDDAAPPPVFYASVVRLMLTHPHGDAALQQEPPYIVQEWPSDERGSARASLNVETGEILIELASGTLAAFPVE